MNDQQPDPATPSATPPPPPADGPIDWTPRDPSSTPPPPPASSGWSAPGEPTVQQPVVNDPVTMQQPPVATPPQMAPPQMAPPTGAAPQFPPTAPPPVWNQPPGGAPPFGAPGTPASPPTGQPKRSRTGLIIGLIVVAALIIGGLAAAAVVLMGGDAGFTVDIETCEIAADGTMTASGSVQNTSGDATDVDVDVVFRDDASSSSIATDSIDLDVPGDSGARWEATGRAGDDVQRVNCDVTVDD